MRCVIFARYLDLEYAGIPSDACCNAAVGLPFATVSGASSGIGKSAAIRLDGLGYTVFAGVRKRSDADNLIKEHPTLRPVMLDVTDDESVQSAVAAVRDSGKPLAACINNAGVGGGLPVELEPMDSIKAMFDVNYFGTVRLTKACLPLLREAHGRVVNIASMASHAPTFRGSTYSGTKSAMMLFGECLRIEMEPFGVSVSTVYPAYVKTRIAAKQLGTPAWRADDIDASLVPLYEDRLERFARKRAHNEELADTTAVTDDAIAHAVADPYPETEYVMGKVGRLPAWLVYRLVWLLPDRVVEFINSRVTG